MSQIASFYLLKNNQRKELSNGDCSGAVYMAICGGGNRRGTEIFSYDSK